MNNMPFDILKEHGHAYYFNQKEINKIEMFEVQLNPFINSGAYIYQDKIIEAKHLVDKIKGLKIEIYSNEHPPPHFHVSGNGCKASFSIDDGKLIENTGFNSKTIKTIQEWFVYSKENIVRVWNKTRPENCVVGKVKNPNNY